MKTKINPLIPFAKPFVPSNEELLPYLDKIRKARMLTHFGPLHQELEMELAKMLRVKFVSLTANGTLALTIALKALDLEGEIITTPFTWVATANAIRWNNLTPVFADVDQQNLNQCPHNTASQITSKTSAILPVHSFGNPCDLEAFSALAKKHGLKLLYDAAHAFGVNINSESLCKFGDLSIISFHPTKAFHTFEGGAIISHDLALKKQLDALINYGFDEDYNLSGIGINGKMNELQAACGLIHLKHFERLRGLRKKAYGLYRNLLSEVEGISLIHASQETELNYAYLPILVDEDNFGLNRNGLKLHLEKQNIITRAYFHPLITDFEQFRSCKSSTPVNARYITERILCLPIFSEISEQEIVRVVESISNCQIKNSRKHQQVSF